MKLRARNVFSSLEVDVNVFASCGKDSAVTVVNGHNDYLLTFNKRPVKCFLFTFNSSDILYLRGGMLTFSISPYLILCTVLLINPFCSFSFSEKETYQRDQIYKKNHCRTFRCSI